MFQFRFEDVDVSIRLTHNVQNKSNLAQRIAATSGILTHINWSSASSRSLRLRQAGEPRCRPCSGAKGAEGLKVRVSIELTKDDGMTVGG